jgi:glycosyltransferase involved in cell wall biosynthesis
VEYLRALGKDVALYDQWTTRLSDFNIVHYFSVFGGSTVFCGFVKNHKKLPLVVSPILWPKGDTSGYPMEEIRRLLQMADRILPNSKAEKELLSEVFQVPLEKFDVVYNGIDPIFFSDDQPEPQLFREHFKITGPFVLNIGNIETRKNQIRLAEACARLGAPLILIGHVRSDAYLAEVLSTSSKAKYLGPMDHHSPLLRSALRACTVFALPSLLETPGLAALEAFALGAPLLVTTEGPTREYFGEHASYVNPQEAEDIFQKLGSLWEGQVSASAAASVTPARIIRPEAKRFSWANTAEQTLASYEKALHQRKS